MRGAAYIFAVTLVFLHVTLHVTALVIAATSGQRVTHRRLSMNLDSKDFVNEGRTLKRYVELKSRPPPVRVPRKRMELQFAVQLMRNSYNAMDSLDFTPTDVFQRLQFLFRQNEWEAYKKDHDTVMQGDLASPSYFDFISWVQFSTLNFCMDEATIDPFIEVVGSEAVSQKVEPLSMLDSRSKIEAVHAAVTGDGVLDYMLSTYPQSILPSGIPLSGSSQATPGGRVVVPDKKRSVGEFLEAATLILDIFSVNSFLLNPSIKLVPQAQGSAAAGASIISLEQTLPANLWSLQTLRQNKQLPNDFVLMVLQALARRMGLSLSAPLSVNLLPNNISLLSVLQLRDTDQAFNRLLERVYQTRSARSGAVKDSPIVTNIKRGESPLPPQVQ